MKPSILSPSDWRRRAARLVCAATLTAALAVAGCYPLLRREAERPEQALVPVRFFLPSFGDDLDSDSLAAAVRRSLEYLDRLPPETAFQYGPDRVTGGRVRETLEAFLDILRTSPDPREFRSRIGRSFKVYRAAGGPETGRILFTGYYEPVLEARLEPDQAFRYPLYRRPNDLLRIDLSRFHPKFKGESIVARVERGEVLPYYSRTEIEGRRALRGRELEIAWLRDPLEVAFLQIQGSGRLRLPDGRSIQVGYEGSNGHPYRSIGRYMLDKGWLSREELSMQSIRGYLSAHPEVIEEVLDYNPSYIFFGVRETGPIGSLGLPLTPGRSAAVDQRLFPKGALAFIASQKPVLGPDGQITGWVPFTRFVLLQDSGGAIKGAGRTDIFWGSGPYAETAAGHMKHPGELYILLKKP